MRSVLCNGLYFQSVSYNCASPQLVIQIQQPILALLYSSVSFGNNKSLNETGPKRTKSTNENKLCLSWANIEMQSDSSLLVQGRKSWHVVNNAVWISFPVGSASQRDSHSSCERYFALLSEQSKDYKIDNIYCDIYFTIYWLIYFNCLCIFMARLYT